MQRQGRGGGAGALAKKEAGRGRGNARSPFGGKEAGRKRKASPGAAAARAAKAKPKAGRKASPGAAAAKAKPKAGRKASPGAAAAKAKPKAGRKASPGAAAAKAKPKAGRKASPGAAAAKAKPKAGRKASPGARQGGRRGGKAPGRTAGAAGRGRKPKRPDRLPIRTEIIDHLCTDPRLEAAVREVGEYDIRLDSDKYESLVQAIITQQLSGKASGAITARLKAMYGGALPSPADVLATSDEDLRAAGLSRGKVSYIKGISELVESGGLDLDSLENMSDDDVVATLTAVKGIGRWTAEMFLIFTLGRLDVLPVGDLGLRKGIKMVYSTRTLPTAAEATRIAERWRPYRTVATWYLWKYQHMLDR